MADLVIVESPAKAKTIAKYLGKGYQVKASMGHLRDLPKKEMGVNIEEGFIPKYVPIEGKDDIIKSLREAAADSDKVYLATDPDREGEAISWHLRELLGLSSEHPNRITFNEITEHAVTEGIHNPRMIDENLVDAQQARRILDRIVGYQLSPLLWRKVRRGLSAGRVQSVVTRLIVDREREILGFQPKEYWSLVVNLSKQAQPKTFPANYYGDLSGKVELTNGEQTETIRASVEHAVFTVDKVKKSEKKRQPAPPFITSTLQQEAAKRLGMQSKRTMAVAQQLYEGVEIEGRGLTGLITYMRTDSTRLSEEAVEAVRGYIRERFGDVYCPRSTRVFKTKNAAQDAHEAIRPSDVNLTPDMLKNSLAKDQLRLYKLIWDRFVACQMANEVLDVVNVDIRANDHLFKASGHTVKFLGFAALYEEKEDEDEENEDEKDVKLPELDEGETLTLRELVPAQHFTQPPPRYNEASLIKTMESLGIGRPSTYAPTISTILERDYVAKEGKALKPTPLGEAVTDLMIDKFSDIVNAKFTAGMEDNLDRVETGHVKWKQVLSEFYDGFRRELEQAEKDLEKTRIKVRAEESDEVCELCGRKMVIKYGRFGKFLACPGYPDCKNAKPIADDTGAKCPKCGDRVLKKKSKAGKTYYGCEHNPKCDFMTWDTTLKEPCPKCGRNLYRHSFKGERRINCLSEGCGYMVEESKPESKKEKKAAKTEGGGENTENAK